MRAIVAWSALFVILWNSGFVGAEFGLPYSGPFTLLFWRYLALSLVTGGVSAIRRELRPLPSRQLARTALVGVLSHGAWLSFVLVAINRGVPAGIVALVVSLQPLITGALAGLATGERTTLRQWIGLLVGFGGVAIAVGGRLTGEHQAASIYYLLPFFSAVAMTAASLVQRRAELRSAAVSLPMSYQLFIQSAATAVVLLGPAVIGEGLVTEWTAAYAGSLVWIVLAVSLAAYALLWHLISRLSATRVASLFYLGPPVTMLMAWIALGDSFEGTDFLGLAVGGLGVLLVSLGHRPHVPVRQSE